MSGSSEIRVLQETNAARRFSRRELARILLAAAPAMSLSSFSLAHRVWESLPSLELPDSAEAALSSPNWKPLALTRDQEESFRVLAEAVVPGSSKALVSRFVDLLLSVDSETPRKKFIGSLTGLDQESARSVGKPIRQLEGKALEKFLTTISTAPRSDGSSAILRGHFEDLKGWIVGAYYSSEIGMRELGWTPDRVFAAFPTCEHPEGHV